jgi:hypothetical protein
MSTTTPPPASGWTPAPSSGVNFTAGPPPGPVPLRSRRWFVPVVAIVVAAVVVVAVLAVASSLAPKSTSGTTESFSTFHEAESVAGSAAAHALSGSWSAELAAGIRLGTGLSLPTANLTSLSNLTANCSISFLPGLPSEVTIDATPPSAPAGHAAFWLIGFSDGGGSLLFVAVDLGIPTPLFSVTASSCFGTSASLVGFPSSEVDSPTLVGAANLSGGSAFLSQYPDAAQLFVGVGGVALSIVTSSPIWEVVDTSCPLPYPINETGAIYNATLSGTGSVIDSGSGPVNCAAGLGSSISGVALLGALHLRASQAI